MLVNASQPSCTLRFYAELNDFLPPERRQCDYAYALQRRASVKDVIEAQGVPHTEVDLILLDGSSVGFGHIVADGERISVYPVFERFDIGSVTRLRPAPLRCTAFIVDANLGRLARYLRLLGVDTWYRNDYQDDEIARLSAETGRILLTRDRNLLKRRCITHGCFIHATEPKAQVRELITRLDLYRQLHPFVRCTRCNGLLQPVAKAQIIDQLPPLTRLHVHEFWRCDSCGQPFWKGAHFRRMQALVAELTAIRE